MHYMAFVWLLLAIAVLEESLGHLAALKPYGGNRPHRQDSVWETVYITLCMYMCTCNCVLQIKMSVLYLISIALT